MADEQDRTGEYPGLSEASPHYHGHRERLRGRFREAGAEAVSEYELLELVLFRAIPQRDVKPLAKDLIAKFGSFAEVVAAPRRDLKKSKASVTPPSRTQDRARGSQPPGARPDCKKSRCCHPGRA